MGDRRILQWYPQSVDSSTNISGTDDSDADMADIVNDGLTPVIIFRQMTNHPPTRRIHIYDYLH